LISQAYAAAGEDAVPERLRSVLASLVLDERVDKRGALGQMNMQLRKRAYSEAEIELRKRNRRDVRVAAAAAAASVAAAP
jgi:hypothetical protein